MWREINCQVCNILFFGRTSAKYCPLCRIDREQKLKLIRDARYKDKKRHAGKRGKALLTSCGLTCLMCGKTGSRYEIVTHHVEHDSSRHNKQVQLCRSCHATEHFDESNLGEKKQAWNKNFRSITKEQIEEALQSTKTMDEAAEAIGVARCSLRKLRTKFGLNVPKAKKIRLSKKDLVSVADKSLKEQAEIFGVSVRSISKFRKKFGLTNNLQ